MAVVGLKMVRVALVDPITQQILKGDQGLSDDGLLEIDDRFWGSAQANITGLSNTPTKRYGNNKPQTSTQAAPEPSVALQIQNLPPDIEAKLLGMIADGKGGYTPHLPAPHVALQIETETPDRASQVYFGFGNGIMTRPSQNVATDQATETYEQDEYTYTAYTTKAFNEEPYKKYWSGAESFDAKNMYSETFGGYEYKGAGTVTTPTTGK